MGRVKRGFTPICQWVTGLQGRTPRARPKQLDGTQEVQKVNKQRGIDHHHGWCRSTLPFKGVFITTMGGVDRHRQFVLSIARVVSIDTFHFGRVSIDTYRWVRKGGVDRHLPLREGCRSSPRSNSADLEDLPKAYK